ncbi:MAG TPA: glycoside hydrolase family 97 protein [Terracidiphilus sp.]|nr:glycoside hydrolase family 97 protein [Terracidiphilus sp.]
MSTLRGVVLCLLTLMAVQTASAQAGNKPADDSPAAQVTSPDGQLKLLLFDATVPGADLRYAVEFHGKRIIEKSKLELELDGQPALGPGMRMTGSQPETADESYNLPMGKTSSVRNHYNGIHADFEGAGSRKLTIEARAFDDGVAFRYIVPDQADLKQVKITREDTEFVFPKDAPTYPLILDGFQSSYEDEYVLRNVSSLHKDWLVALPFLANVPGVGWVGITEADIENYAGMYIRKSDGRGFSVHAELAPHRNEAGTLDPEGVAVETQTPFSSPWRVLMIADEPGRMIESNMVLNLNPPSKVADTSWIQPGKSAWDWWSGEAAPSVHFKTGMNTATMKHYIDFASASGLRYMLIDAGWALAPDRKGPQDYAVTADITKVTPEIDMPELLRYAKEKNVRIWLWSHWTSVNKYMDQAFPLFEKWGIAGVKIDFMNRDDQWMVDWYRRVAAKAAEHHLMLDYHGAFKPDGLRRTYPNVLTREGVMGKEYLKWSAEVTPAHNATLPYTRMLAGPMDYTPGAFGNTNLENFIPRSKEPMAPNTRAQELALYVIFESEFEMVSDYPEHYAGQKEFDFIKRVPCTWDEVRFLGGMPTQWVALARRSGNDWYVGSLTNSDSLSVKIPLAFLGPGKYVAEIYADAPDAADQPTHVAISRQPVDKSSVIDVQMAPGGGNAMWIHPAQ